MTCSELVYPWKTASGDIRGITIFSEDNTTVPWCEHIYLDRSKALRVLYQLKELEKELTK